MAMWTFARSHLARGLLHNDFMKKSIPGSPSADLRAVFADLLFSVVI
jgi:hypothetical protein